MALADFPQPEEEALPVWIPFRSSADSKTALPPSPRTFGFCKLACFNPDGSRFENLTGGPNNIWGLVISRLGETFIQEANDMGHPAADFVPGKHYPTGFGPRIRDDR